MHDRRARAALIGLTLAFPLLMALAVPRPSQARQTGLTLFGVEAVLVGGFLTASRERRLLQAERDRAPVVRTAPSVPHVPARAPRRAAVRPSPR
jgi:hypothetical protein